VTPRVCLARPCGSATGVEAGTRMATGRVVVAESTLEVAARFDWQMHGDGVRTE
jgi:hypothetical protein